MVIVYIDLKRLELKISSWKAVNNSKTALIRNWIQFGVKGSGRTVIFAISCRQWRCIYCRQWRTLSPLSPMAPRTLDGDLEYSIDIYCRHCRHLNGDHWRSPMATGCAIGDNGCIAIGDKKWPIGENHSSSWPFYQIWKTYNVSTFKHDRSVDLNQRMFSAQSTHCHKGKLQ